MRIKITIFLFLANILVFGLIFYLDSTRSSSPVIVPAGILGTEIETATEFKIEGVFGEGRPQVERHFVLENQRWFLETPYRWPANRDGISRMFASLLFLEPEIRFSVSEIESAGKNLADYGLDPARLTLTFEVPGKGPLELRIGAPTEIGNRLYVLSPDQNEILVTSVDLLKAFAVDVEAIRDRRVFDIPDFEVRELVTRITTTGDLTVRLRKDAEKWRFEAPIEVEADIEMVRTTLRQLTRLEAQTFPDTIAPESRISTITQPRIRITLEGNDRRETLLVGQEGPMKNGVPTYYAQREDRPVVVTVPAEPFDQLLQAQRDLRERDFLRLNTATLTGFELGRGSSEGSLELKRLETGSWQVVDSDEEGKPRVIAADPEVVNRLLRNLERIEALDFVSNVPSQSDLESYGFSEPTWTLRFEDSSGDERVLLVGDETQMDNGRSVRYMKMENERFVYAVTSDVMRLWITDPLYYRDRTLQNLGQAIRIQRVLVERIGEETEILLDESIDPATQTWGLYLESWPLEEQGPFWDLIGQFRTFEVAAFLENRFSPSGYGSLTETYPWALKVKLTLALPEGDSGFKMQEQTFYFTERISGSFQAGGSPENNSMFQVDSAMIENLFKLFLERPLPPEFAVGSESANTDASEEAKSEPPPESQ